MAVELGLQEPTAEAPSNLQIVISGRVGFVHELYTSVKATWLREDFPRRLSKLLSHNFLALVAHLSTGGHLDSCVSQAAASSNRFESW